MNNITEQSNLSIIKNRAINYVLLHAVTLKLFPIVGTIVKVVDRNKYHK